MKKGKTILLSLLTTLVIGGIIFYVELPALNMQAEEFYLFLIALLVIFQISWLVFAPKNVGQQKVIDFNGASVSVDPKAFFRSVPRFPLVMIAVLIAVMAVGSIISAPIFNASKYYELLDVKEGSFTEDVAEISYREIPMLDADSATQLGRRTLGDIAANGAYSNLVSQFEPTDTYTQINYQGEPVRVSPLAYGDIIKWFNNTSEGLPGYIVVNMVSQKADLVILEEGMKYSDTEFFNRNLQRHVRFQYPTYMFAYPTFELDEEGTPFWVSPRVVKRIGLFGGMDIQGAVLTNAITGESQYYEEVPSWVDRVYRSDLIIEQYDYHGMLVNGFINSVFGEKGCTVTTDGYNYIVIGDDVYLYTGVTSTGTDASNVGFILSNQRTKETKYYPITGAEEYSAMNSAQGAVQHLGYRATFPILLNIADQPTYFMALKDSAELVKMYAMVNVSDYQITATGGTVAQCQQAYEQMLADNGVEISQSGGTGVELQGRVAELRSAVIEGNTWYYVKLEGAEVFYALCAADDPRAVLLNVGDAVTLLAEPEAEGEIISAQLAK